MVFPLVSVHTRRNDVHTRRNKVNSEYIVILIIKLIALKMYNNS